MALRVDDEDDEDEDDQAKLRQSNLCEHRNLLRPMVQTVFASGVRGGAGSSHWCAMMFSGPTRLQPRLTRLIRQIRRHVGGEPEPRQPKGQATQRRLRQDDVCRRHACRREQHIGRGARVGVRHAISSAAVRRRRRTRCPPHRGPPSAPLRRRATPLDAPRRTCPCRARPIRRRPLCPSRPTDPRRQ